MNPLLPSLQPAQPSSLQAAGHTLLDEAFRHLAAGDQPRAAQVFQQVLRSEPRHVAAALGLARLHLNSGRHTPARALVLQALRGDLVHPKLALDLMAMLDEVAEVDWILELSRQLPPQVWGSAAQLAQVAQLLSDIGANLLALDYSRAALAKAAMDPSALYVQAQLDMYFGDFASAAAHASALLKQYPGDPSALFLLSMLRLPDAGARIDQCRAALATGVHGEDEVYLAYALHNELHERGDYAPAWEALERACRVKRALLNYVPERDQPLFDALATWTAHELNQDDGSADDSLRPIFVIGMYRSGTTLVERMLSGHPEIAAGGETYGIQAMLRRATGLHFGRNLDPAVIGMRAALDYRSIGDGYLAWMRWRSGGRRWVTDKLPSNVLNAGFIARALPNARFILLDRDPVDVGLSSLRTLFSEVAGYSYDQMDYVRYYREFERLAAHWKHLLGERLLTIDYEELIQRPDQASEAMARFLGLGYHPDMVHIEKRREAAATASSVMMRDGIRRDRGRLWWVYRDRLGPLLDGFNVARDLRG